MTSLALCEVGANVVYHIDSHNAPFNVNVTFPLKKQSLVQKKIVKCLRNEKHGTTEIVKSDASLTVWRESSFLGEYRIYIPDRNVNGSLYLHDEEPSSPVYYIDFRQGTMFPLFLFLTNKKEMTFGVRLSGVFLPSDQHDGYKVISLSVIGAEGDEFS